MQYDLLYPLNDNQAHDVPCVIAASYFDISELTDFGVSPDSFEFDDAIADSNEFEKVFKLWDSPIYLKQFFNRHIDYFKQEYWNGITQSEFLDDVSDSLNKIRTTILNLFNTHDFGTVVEPLSPEEEDLRLYKSIRVKMKQGWIHRRLAFRFYAVEIEENKCYIITGAAIKIHKDMMKAPNTKIEKAKLEAVLKDLTDNGVDTKEAFLDFIGL
ncbi:MAG: hypothetical protein HDS92_00150 [Bacteroidales bacterium]|nr:hypothetical protein [Bacteroidales bacterium]